jgi:hypothetical protein
VRETQGRCRTCEIRFVWPSRKGLLRGAHCERCGTQLRQTIHFAKCPVVELPEGPIYDRESVEIIRRKAGLWRHQ